MRDDLQDSYMATETWKKLLADETGYDLVLLMLGTNDSHRDQDWDDSDDSRFKRSCKTLLTAVKEKNPNATFVMMNCPKYFDPNGKFASPHIRELQLETANGSTRAASRFCSTICTASPTRKWARHSSRTTCTRQTPATL